MYCICLPARRRRICRNRTAAPNLTNHSCAIFKEHVFSQPETGLRRSPAEKKMVGVPGLEPGTSSLSGMRSNRLSYTPGLPRRSSQCRRLRPCPAPPAGSAAAVFVLRCRRERRLVELRGFEPLTSCLQSRCSSQLSYSPSSPTTRGPRPSRHEQCDAQNQIHPASPVRSP